MSTLRTTVIISTGLPLSSQRRDELDHFFEDVNRARPVVVYSASRLIRATHNKYPRASVLLDVGREPAHESTVVGAVGEVKGKQADRFKGPIVRADRNQLTLRILVSDQRNGVRSNLGGGLVPEPRFGRGLKLRV